ncbi:MAG: hypothetical protein JST21_15695 [Bacteroidetes bacterium]|nr:hypothetical protein [Bacteroidota bacterium]
MEGKTFSAGRFTYTMYHDRGKVVGKDKNLETVVSGGGGGGGNYQGTGGNTPVSITSRTYVHDKIYLQKPDGKERAVEVTNWDVACREGNDVLVTWIVKQGKDGGPYVALKNFTMDSQIIGKSAIIDLANHHLIKNPLISFSIGLVLCFVFYFLAGENMVYVGIVAMIAYEIFISIQSSKAGTVITKQVQQFFDAQQ